MRIGDVYDGRWEAISESDGTYTLRNQFNGTEILVPSDSLRQIERGKLTVSAFMHQRIEREEALTPYRERFARYRPHGK